MLTKAQADVLNTAIVPLIDGATITPDFADGDNFSVTIAGNRVLANPLNVKPGRSGIITITQDGAGNRSISFGASWKFENGNIPSLSTGPSATDALVYYVESASRITARLIEDVK